MAASRLSILFNPSAGMGRALARKAELEYRLRRYGVTYDLTVTESEDHLRRLTREHARAYGGLVGAGGDSTFHIMANEIMAVGAKIPFGMIPVGSSNDIAREFGVGSLETACRALQAQKSRTIDIGCAYEGERLVRYFLGQANIGLGVFVNGYVTELARRNPRLAKHQTLAGVKGILKAYRDRRIPVPLVIESEAGQIGGKWMAAVVSNVRYWATGKIINPGALPDDGRLDLCLIKSCSLTRLARISMMAGRGRHGRAKEVQMLQSRDFKISSEVAFGVQADGEILASLENAGPFRTMTLKIAPQSLTVIYEESSRRSD